MFLKIETVTGYFNMDGLVILKCWARLVNIGSQPTAPLAHGKNEELHKAFYKLDEPKRS